MTRNANSWTSHPEPAGSNAGAGTGAYHPQCTKEQAHKPTKAIVGVGLLVVLSFLLYEFNGKVSGQHSEQTPTVIQHNLASNH